MILALIILGIVLLVWLGFKEEILNVLSIVGVFTGVGVVLFWIVFNRPGLGALVGGGLALLLIVKVYAEAFRMASPVAGFAAAIYYMVSMPFYLLNQLQILISRPWRPFTKYNRLSGNVKTYLEPTLEVLGIILTIAITPLRALNAAYYNILVHGVTAFYDYFLEVLRPSGKDEGAGNAGRWFLMLPWRFVKYIIGHGLLAIGEGVLWTVIDIFVPAYTMYHGTDLTAAQSIAGSKERNETLKRELGWNSGTFTASQSSWGGIGVYFASRRAVAVGYASDPYRLSDRNPVIIVCRVSPGRVMSYGLAPWRIYNSAGQNGNPSRLTSYAKRHSYVTGEWWNPRGRYWEYCLFDWQNLYNEPWRIRPVYLFNCRTGLAQHIRGGMAHWTVSKYA